VDAAGPVRGCLVVEWLVVEASSSAGLAFELQALAQLQNVQDVTHHLVADVPVALWCCSCWLFECLVRLRLASRMSAGLLRSSSFWTSALHLPGLQALQQEALFEMKFSVAGLVRDSEANAVRTHSLIMLSNPCFSLSGPN